MPNVFVTLSLCFLSPLLHAFTISQDRFELMNGEDASSFSIGPAQEPRLLKTQVVLQAGPCKADDLLVSPSYRIVPENTEQIVRIFFRGLRVSACEFVVLVSADPKTEPSILSGTSKFGMSAGHGVRVLVQPKTIQVKSRAVIINNRTLAIQTQGNAYDQVRSVEINNKEYLVNWRLIPGKPQPFNLPAPPEGKVRFKTKFQAWIPVKK